MLLKITLFPSHIMLRMSPTEHLKNKQFQYYTNYSRLLKKNIAQIVLEIGITLIAKPNKDRMKTDTGHIHLCTQMEKSYTRH